MSVLCCLYHQRHLQPNRRYLGTDCDDCRPYRRFPGSPLRSSKNKFFPSTVLYRFSSSFTAPLRVSSIKSSASVSLCSRLRCFFSFSLSERCRLRSRSSSRPREDFRSLLRCLPSSSECLRLFLEDFLSSRFLEGPASSSSSPGNDENPGKDENDGTPVDIRTERGQSRGGWLSCKPGVVSLGWWPEGESGMFCVLGILT